MRVCRLVAAMLVVMAAAVSGWAQDGVITGRVSDTSDAVLPGVTIGLTSSSVMGGRTQISDEHGNYRFTVLPPGVYTVKFELPSFKTLVREGIQITAGFTATVNATLEVASATDTVTVVSDTPTVDLERATVSTTFGANLLENLPISNNYYEVFQVMPGVSVTVPDVGGSRVHQQQNIRNYGTDAQYTIRIDGILVTQDSRAMSMYYDDNSMRELQVVNVSKSAEIPTAGIAVNMVVKDGGNQVHGSLNTDYINPRFQGNNLTPAYRAAGITYTKWGRYNDTYFDVGGPVLKDKFWWYGAYKQLDLAQQILGFYKASDVWVEDCGTHGNCITKPAQGQNVPARYNTRNRNLTVKLTYQVNSKNSLSFTSLFFDKWDPERGSDSNGRFFTDNDTGILYKPIWAQGLRLNTVLSSHATLESQIGIHRDGPRHEYSKTNYLTMRDLDTQERRGAYDTSGVHQTQNKFRFQEIETLGLNKSGLAGTHNVRTGFEWRYEQSVVYNDPRSYNLRTEWRGGFKTPAFIYTYDAPFSTDDRVKHQVVFFNDSWKMTRRLTVNLGFRYDRHLPYKPRQTKSGIYPYQDQLDLAPVTFEALNNPVGRLSAVYDIFGNGKTAIKVAYAGYSWEPHTDISSGGDGQNANTLGTIAKRYTWDGVFNVPGWVKDPNGQYRFTPWPCAACAVPGAVPFIPDPTKLVSVTGAIALSRYSGLKLGRTDEYMVDLEQEIKGDTTVRFTVVRQRILDTLQTYNQALPFSAYNIPVTFTDPGRDAIVGTADDQKLTVYSLDRSYVGKADYIMRNQPGRVDNFLQYSFEGTKRFSRKWQALSGLEFWHFKFGADVQNPNQAINTGQNYWMWQFKALGTYELPKGFHFSATLRSLKGQPRNRTINTPSVNQGVITVNAEPSGSRFQPTYSLMDLNFQKTLTVSERWGQLRGEITIANIFNNNAILRSTNLTGSTYDQVNGILDPRVFRLGAGWRF